MAAETMIFRVYVQERHFDVHAGDWDQALAAAGDGMGGTLTWRDQSRAADCIIDRFQAGWQAPGPDARPAWLLAPEIA